MRIDPRVGVVLNLVQIVDEGRARSVLYEASVSELFVPYMDPSNGWNNRAFIDAGEFFAGVGFLKPLKPGLDCPAGATWFDGHTVNEDGAPKLTSRLACLFERASENPAWRHLQGGESTMGDRVASSCCARPRRSATTTTCSIGASSRMARSRSRSAPPVSSRRNPRRAQGRARRSCRATTGQLVAEGVIWRQPRSLLQLPSGLRRGRHGEQLHAEPDGSAAARQRSDAQVDLGEPACCRAREKRDAILDIRLDQPSMWMFMNPSVKGPLNYPGYELMPGATASRSCPPDDPVQRIGAFSEHQFWVTPYTAAERYAAGTYPTESGGQRWPGRMDEGQSQYCEHRYSGQYTLGFHHVTRAEDWPVMPTMWHEFDDPPVPLLPEEPGAGSPEEPRRPMRAWRIESSL